MQVLDNEVKSLGPHIDLPTAKPRLDSKVQEFTHNKKKHKVNLQQNTKDNAESKETEIC